jgi:hypothetical protein
MAAHLTERRLEVVSAVLLALATVLFASALFFAGISSKFTGVGVRAAILGLGCLVALVTLAYVATLPVHLTG